MKKTWPWIVTIGLCVCLSAGSLPAEDLEPGKAALFLQDGQMVIGQIEDLSRTPLILSLKDGREFALQSIWMISFVNTDWNFPKEREKMDKDQHYLIFRNGRMTSGKILDFSHIMGFQFDTEESVPLAQIRRIYFTSALPPAYQDRLAEEAGQKTGFVGTFSGDISSGVSVWKKVTLTLNEDGTALLTQTFPQGQTPIAEQGTWAENPDGTITVRTTVQTQIRRAQTAPLVFRLENGELVAVQFDPKVWGGGGLKLKRT
ncbi:MAG: hypothetical protein WBC70_16120 [Candidatus Aminicenantales bacterium]